MYDDLKKIIQESKYEIFGLRRDDLEYKIGDTFPNSNQLFQDPQYADFACTKLLYPYIEEGVYKGFYDAGELNGTSTIYVNINSIEESLNLVNSYDGKYLYLVAGGNYSYGNDVGEIIIEDAKVVKVIVTK